MGTTRPITFVTAREIGEQLPGTEVGTAYGLPALKVNGRIYAGIAINKEAEPNSLAVYPIVLVRLARVTRDALGDLLRGAHRVVSSKPPVRRRARKRRR